MIAGNIAGAATLAATADIDTQKQAVRDGVVDFLVTSLDEALRILKNEIRKRNTVAVCVSASPAQIAREMLERGVQPDLLREQFTTSADESESADVRLLSVFEEMGEGVVTSWAVSSSPANWLPKIDAIALDLSRSRGPVSPPMASSCAALHGPHVAESEAAAQ